MSSLSSSLLASLRRSRLLSPVRGVGLAAVVCLATSVAQAAPSAADRAAADALYNDAKKLASEGRFVEACPKFAQSQQLDPGVGTLLYLGECYEKTARIASAWVTFREAADLARTTNQPQREKVASERASALEKRLPRLVIEASAPMADLKVQRDGATVLPALLGTPLPVDAGSHTIAVSAPGKKPWSLSVELSEGATIKVKIPPLEDLPAAPPSASSAPAAATSAAPPPPPPASAQPPPSSGSLSTRQTWALVSGGVGVVGIGLGSYFGLRALSLWDKSKDNCIGTRCGQTGYDNGNSANTSATASSVLFAVGALGLGAGAALWFWPSAGNNPATAVRVGPGSIALEGRW